MSFTVIPPDEVEGVVVIIDDILKTQHRHPVGYYKKKYHLTEDEYQMIYNLVVPFMRNKVYGGFMPYGEY